MADVFISYAREDDAFVRKLHQALAAAQCETWVDWQGIPPTAEWLAEIYRAIDSSNAAIFVVSPPWVQSRVCRLELDHAAAQGKRLIPIVCADVPEGSVPAALARLNWVLMRPADNFDDALRRLLEAQHTDLDWVRAHTRLVVRAAEWDARRRDDSGMLRGADLADAERWLGEGARHTDPAPTALQADYIVHSRQAATRRQRTTLGAVAAALVIAVGLAIWAVLERGTAQDNAVRAQSNAEQAQKNEREALAQRRIAVEQRGIAETRAIEARAAQAAETTQRLAAEAARHEAVVQRDEAVRQRRAAQARQLAARAEFLSQGSDPGLAQKAVLLAAESMNLMPNVEADQVLRRALQRLAPRIGELPHAGLVEPLAVAGTGSWLVIGDTEGVLRRFNLAEMREESARHIGKRIRVVAVAPIGRTVAAGVRGEGLVVFDERADAPVRELRDPGCDVLALAFSRTASHLAAGCMRELVLWDTRTWRDPVRIRVAEEVAAVALHPHGTHVAALDSVGDLRVWDLRGTPVAHIVEQEPGASTRWGRCCIGFLTFSINGKYLAANNLQQRDVRVVNTSDWKMHARLDHEAAVHVLSADPQGEYLATGSVNGRVRVWDLDSARLISIADHAAEITHMRLDIRPLTGGASLVSASTDRTVRVWDPWTGVERLRASQVGPVVWADVIWGRLVAATQYKQIGFWKPDPAGLPFRLFANPRAPATLATCADDISGSMVFAHTAGAATIDKDGKRTHSVSFATRNQPGHAFAPGCRWLALGSDDALEVHAPLTGLQVFRQPGYYAHTELAFSSRARWLVVNKMSADSQLWRTDGWKAVDLPAACAKPRDLIASPDERTMALRCGDDIVLIDSDSGRELARRTQKAATFRFVPPGRQLIVRSPKRLQLLALPGLAEQASVELPAGAESGQLAISPDGAHLAIAGWKRQSVWSLPSLRSAGVIDEQVAGRADDERLVFAGDGASIIVFGDQRLRVVRLRPWRPVLTLEHPGGATAVAVDLVRRRIAAAITSRPPERDEQHGVRVWNLDSGIEIARIGLERATRSVRFSGDGRFLMADNLYTLEPSDLVASSCKLLARNLTRHEWTRELGDMPYRPTCTALGTPDDTALDWER